MRQIVDNDTFVFVFLFVFYIICGTVLHKTSINRRNTVESPRVYLLLLCFSFLKLVVLLIPFKLLDFLKCGQFKFFRSIVCTTRLILAIKTVRIFWVLDRFLKKNISNSCLLLDGCYWAKSNTGNHG